MLRWLWLAPLLLGLPVRADVVVEGGETRLVFADAADGLRLLELVHVPTGTSFVRPGAVPQTVEVDVRVEPNAPVLTLQGVAGDKAEVRDDGSTLLAWKLTSPDGGPTASVEAVLTPDQRGVACALTAGVEGGVLEQVRFPVLTHLGREGDDADGDALLLPYGVGRLLQQPSQARRHQVWPSAVWPSRAVTMQWLGYQRAEGATLVVMTEDGQGQPKELLAHGQVPEPGLLMQVGLWPEETGLLSRYRWRYPVRLAALAGDWYDAAQFYRQWALQQEWVPEAGRPDTPAWWRGPQVHVQSNAGGAGYLVKVAENARQFTDLPMTAFFAFWFNSGFDDNYPEYFPIRPHVKDDVAAMQAMGVRAHPYINGTLWDIDTPSFLAEGAIRAAAKGPDGRIRLQGWAGQNHATMCPWTQFWRDKVTGIVRREVEEFGADALYLDQIGASGPARCFDSDHGHLRGATLAHVQGNRLLLRQVQDLLGAIKPDAVVTTEDNAEVYIDLIDSALGSAGVDYGDAAPFFPAVYHEYVTIHARGQDMFRRDEPHETWRLKIAQELVWGLQLGHLRDVYVGNPHYRAGNEYLGRLAAVRARGIDWLGYGTMLRPLVLDGVEPVGAKWGYNPPYETVFPSVLNGVFAAPDGGRAIVLANVLDREQTVSFGLEGEWVERGADGERPVVIEGGRATVTVPAADGMLLIER